MQKGELIVLTPRKKEYLASQEVARWLGVSTRTITYWAEQWRDSAGQEGIPAFKLGRAWRFDPNQRQLYT
jgi:transposase-like protein